MPRSTCIPTVLLLTFLVPVLTTAPCAAQDDEKESIPRIGISPAFPKLKFTRPIQFIHADDGTDRLYVAEQAGRVLTFMNDSKAEYYSVFIDLRDIVNDRSNEEGLLSIAFHPDFETNNHFFLNYSASNPRRSVLSRFTVMEEDRTTGNPSTEEVLLEVAQPYWNHNGSTIKFGPDGYLYISLGDGGAGGDPQKNGQNLGTLLGTILRIDVDARSGELPYAIPPDNPFVHRSGARGEIWAYGLRNAWRFSFDRETGDLWAGDVGQNAWEEIDLVTRGGNYGWRIREGKHQFWDDEPSLDPMIDPVVEYPRRDGISVTGGYVYRGSAYPDLQGVYLYADYAHGRIWGLRYENGKMTDHRDLSSTQSRKLRITSFGEDRDGELYVCDLVSERGKGTNKGRIYRITVR